jgi:hypothetical protein
MQKRVYAEPQEGREQLEIKHVKILNHEMLYA